MGFYIEKAEVFLLKRLYCQDRKLIYHGSPFLDDIDHDDFEKWLKENGIKYTRNAYSKASS